MDSKVAGVAGRREETRYAEGEGECLQAARLLDCLGPNGLEVLERTEQEHLCSCAHCQLTLSIVAAGGGRADFAEKEVQGLREWLFKSLSDRTPGSKNDAALSVAQVGMGIGKRNARGRGLAMVGTVLIVAPLVFFMVYVQMASAGWRDLHVETKRLEGVIAERETLLEHQRNELDGAFSVASYLRSELDAIDVARQQELAMRIPSVSDVMVLRSDDQITREDVSGLLSDLRLRYAGLGVIEPQEVVEYIEAGKAGIFPAEDRKRAFLIGLQSIEARADDLGRQARHLRALISRGELELKWIDHKGLEYVAADLRIAAAILGSAERDFGKAFARALARGLVQAASAIK